MPAFKCPQCASIVRAEPGKEAVCGNCGFHALVPPAGAPGPAASASPAPAPLLGTSAPIPRATGEPVAGAAQPVAKSAAAWSWLLSIAGLGTFFLAAYGLPFLLALGGVALGIVSYVKDTRDRRGLIASVLGGVAVLAAVAFLLAG